MLGVLVWFILGAAVGFIWNLVDPAPAKGGVWGSIILGVLGALAGGILASLIENAGSINLGWISSIVAILGGLALTTYQKLFLRESGKIKTKEK